MKSALAGALEAHMSRTCPKCGSDDIAYQTFQENRGSKTVTRKKTRITGRVDIEHEHTPIHIHESHGCLWWVFIGWWWMFFEYTFKFMFMILGLIFRLAFEMVIFIPRLIINLIAGNGITAKTTSTSRTRNKVVYRKVAQCQECGHTWKC